FSIAIRINSKDQILGVLRRLCWKRRFAGKRFRYGSQQFRTARIRFVITGDVLDLNNRGEIAGNGLLRNGDIRFFTLTPVSGGGAAIESTAIRRSHQPSKNLTHGRLTPEVLAKLRARLKPRYHVPGLPIGNDE